MWLTPGVTTQFFRVVLNNGTATRPHYQFEGFVTNLDIDGMEIDGDPITPATIKVAGAVTKGTTTIP